MIKLRCFSEREWHHSRFEFSLSRRSPKNLAKNCLTTTCVRGLGSGSQHDLLLRDQCILVDGQDQILGSASKRDAHRFDGEQPEGLLHRAFSVFLFDQDQQLLLQQRASGKVLLTLVRLLSCATTLHRHKITEIRKFYFKFEGGYLHHNPADVCEAVFQAECPAAVEDRALSDATSWLAQCRCE